MITNWYIERYSGVVFQRYLALHRNQLKWSQPNWFYFYHKKKLIPVQYLSWYSHISFSRGRSGVVNCAYANVFIVQLGRLRHLWSESSQTIDMSVWLTWWVWNWSQLLCWNTHTHLQLLLPHTDYVHKKINMIHVRRLACKKLQYFCMLCASYHVKLLPSCVKQNPKSFQLLSKINCRAWTEEADIEKKSASV